MCRLPKLRRSITYLFGLACGMYQNRFYTEMLLAAADVSPTEAKSINYRGKARTLSASNFTFQVTGQNGPIGKAIDYKGLPFYLGKHAFFRINACNYCRDVFAEAADACYMDAWLPEYQEDLKGNSLVLVRNPAVQSLFEDARTGGSLAIDSIPIAKVIQSQKGHVHRKREAISMRMGTRETVPGRDNHHGFLQRSAWWLQKRTQGRSKRAWARYGRYGLTVFWLAMLDLLMLQETLDWTSRIAHMPQRLWRKVHTFTRG